jgi:hypothetical protein
MAMSTIDGNSNSAEFSARSHMLSSTFDSAASGALADSGAIFQSFLLASTGSSGRLHPTGSHSTSSLAQNIASGNGGASAGFSGRDNKTARSEPREERAHDEFGPVLGEGDRDRELWSGASYGRRSIALDPAAEQDFKAIKVLIQNLEEIEADTDSFAIPSNERSDYLALFGRVVETILIILAVQHSINLTKIEANMFVAPLLFLLVYFSSQIKYMITHWTRLVALSRRRINNSEREELVERQRWERDRVDAADRRRRQENRASAYSVLTGKTADDELVFDRHANHEVPRHIREMYPSHAVYTLAQVRLASSEMIFTFINSILYLVNIYITFLFIRSVLDKINASFSDGIWVMVRATVFVLLVIPVYVEFQISGYRQETVARSIRLG